MGGGGGGRVQGSSPHTRGAPDRGPTLVLAARDHPRIRGEHETSGAHRAGSPGIIPAYAGSTTVSAAPEISDEDHPRIRGEHEEPGLPGGREVGSSPHTRGARRGCRKPSSGGRIIPAYAGSTALASSHFADSTDHPRIRGEHGRRHRIRGHRGGSSPHTRGAQGVAGSGPVDGRIIPAYAGSTSLPQPLTPPSPDHPRIRGEHHAPSAPPVSHPGSSPHTRGARQERGAQLRRHRIIPAYAGSTDTRCHANPRPADHPRIRGEHDSMTSSAIRAFGSSPHTRGARDS